MTSDVKLIGLTKTWTRQEHDWNVVLPEPIKFYANKGSGRHRSIVVWRGCYIPCRDTVEEILEKTNWKPSPTSEPV